MTSATQMNDTSNQFHVDDNFKRVDDVCISSESRSDKGFDEVLPDRVINIRAGAADKLQVPYNIERERARIMNRLYNLGVPESQTFTNL